MDKVRAKKKALPAAKVQGSRRVAGVSSAPKRKKPSKLVTKSRTKTKRKAKASVEELLLKVTECVENFEYDLALQYCETALTVAPSNVDVLETSGGLLLELGDVDRATQCFKSAIEFSPNEGHRKYLCLGQLSDGEEAVKLLLKGIDIMTKQFHCQGSSATPCGVGDVTALDISTAYCSLAELYLTDCCFDDDAEVKCGEYCTKALEYCRSNPEAHQLMGSYLLSKLDMEKARSTLLEGLSLWLSTSNDDCCGASFNVEMPSYQSQVSWAKLLIEVEEYEMAHLVLEQLLKEDDEMVEVWYLLGWLAHLRDELPTAGDCLRKCKELYSVSGCQDEQLAKHVEELLEELDDQLPDISDGEEDNSACSSGNEMEVT